MSVISRLMFVLGIPMYTVQDNSISGAYKTREYMYTNATIYTAWGANRKIKRMDKETAKRLENVIKQAYPEMVEELL